MQYNTMRKKKAIIGIYIFYMLAAIPETKTQKTDSHRTVNIENNQEIKKKKPVRLSYSLRVG